MSIRESARQAFIESRSNIESEAREILFSTLAPLDVELLTVHLEITEEYILYVFTDTAHDVHLAARKTDKWCIYLVNESDGWTIVEELKSLAHLGELLPPLPPDAELPPAWNSDNNYSIGDLVTHNDLVWESTVNNNIGWEPGVVHSVWVLA